MSTAPSFLWDQSLNSNLQVNSVALAAAGSPMVAATSDEQGSSTDFTFYCLENTGQNTPNILWQAPYDTSGGSVQQGFFTVAIAGGGSTCAAGGGYSDQEGKVLAFNVSEGASSRYEYPTNYRVNMVAMNNSGDTFIAVGSDQVMLFEYDDDGPSHKDTYTVYGGYLSGGYISQDGGLVAVAGSGSDGGYAGFFQVYDGKLHHIQSFYPSDELLEAAMTDDGQYVAASTKSGAVILYQISSDRSYVSEVWSSPYTPPNVNPGRSYAVAVSNPDSDTVLVGVGVNILSSNNSSSQGYIYVLSTTVSNGSGTPSQLWNTTIDHGPNPGMNMDQNGNFLTATDGEPGGENGNETSGSFYLFNAQTGEQLWQKSTGIENWQLPINPSGTACFGGSDNGSVYYWGQSNS